MDLSGYRVGRVRPKRGRPLFGGPTGQILKLEKQHVANLIWLLINETLYKIMELKITDIPVSMSPTTGFNGQSFRFF